MNLRQSVGRLKNHEHSLESGTTPEEAHQLDLLLSEISEHEHDLTPSYWANQAQVFTDRLATQENAKKARRAARYTRLKPYLGSLLPLGGLVALGLVLSRPQAAPVALVAPNETVAVVAATNTVEIAAPESDAVPNEATNPLPVAPVSRAQVPTEPAVKHTRATRATAKKPAPVHEAVAPVNESPTIVTPVEETNVAAPTNVEPEHSPETNPNTQTKAPEADTFAAQLQALKRADKALKSGDNNTAKTALSRSFSPQSGLHVNALRAVLACQTHDAVTGKRYLTAQATSHPNSPYLDRMRRACGVTSFGNSTTTRQK